MRIFGLLAWYDEPEDWLRELVDSCTGLVDILVAVDGAYKLYPDAQPHSPAEQWNALTEAADLNNLPLYVHTPTEAWAGNEVEKRAFMFQYGRECGATPDDWFLILDGDMHVGDYDIDHVRAQLEATPLDVAEVTFVHKTEGCRPENFRSLFRALPTLTVEGMHYCYTARAADGRRRFMWHPPFGKDYRTEPALDIAQYLNLIHRKTPRSRERYDAAASYYESRDQAGIERAANIA